MPKENGIKRIFTPTAVMLLASAVILSVIGGFFALVIVHFASVHAEPADDPTAGATVTADAPPAVTATSEATADTTEDTFPLYPTVPADVTVFSDELNSKYAMLIDADTMTATAVKNAVAVIYPASLTKIMTVIVAYENAASLDDTFVMTQEILDPLEAANASVAGFAAGETVKLRDLIYGAILPSGADATVGLAHMISGSEADFVKLMNDKCAELGLRKTHFVNTSGLHDPDHYSTLADMAVILKYAMDIPFLAEVLGADKYYTSWTPQHPNGIELTSTSYARMGFIHQYGDITVVGAKTGYTDEAEHCLITFARNNKTGKTYIFVCIKGQTMYEPVTDMRKVYDTIVAPSY